MQEFFVAHIDYIFFVYGLAFIVLAVTAHFISHARPAQVFWQWIALFGLTHGVTEWLDMLALSLGDSALFQMIRIAFLTGSFLCFVEVFRSEVQKRWSQISGPWFYAPLLFLTLGSGWMLGGLAGINIMARYVLGAIGGLLAARTIMAAVSRGSGRTLSVFAGLLGCYAGTQFFALQGAFLPASWINQEAFFSLLGFPIQLLRMILAISMAGVVWRVYSNDRVERAAEIEAKKRMGIEFLFPVSLVVILVVGGILTELIGEGKKAEESADRLNRVKVAAVMIPPDQIKSLSGTPADLVSASYQRLLGQFLNILQENTDTLYVYLFGRKDGKNIFLVDSELPGRRISSEPLAIPGEVYEPDAELLRRMFASGGVLTVGPETDKWGTFISSLVAIHDPASGKVIAILGFDYDAKAWVSMIRHYRLAPLLITLLFSLLSIVFFFILLREKDILRDAQVAERALQGLLFQLKKESENLAHEIEDRKLLEKVSFENALFLQKLMDSIPMPVFYKDISGVYIGCNKVFEMFFGISQKEIIGKKVEDLFPPDVARIYQKMDAELLALPGVQVYELAVRNARGESRNVIFHKATFAGPAGEMHGIIGVIIDKALLKSP